MNKKIEKIKYTHGMPIIYITLGNAFIKKNNYIEYKGTISIKIIKNDSKKVVLNSIEYKEKMVRKKYERSKEKEKVITNKLQNLEKKIRRRNM